MGRVARRMLFPWLPDPFCAEAEPLHDSLLQFLRLVPSLREGTRRKNCKKSSRSPQATMLTAESDFFEKPWDKLVKC